LTQVISAVSKECLAIRKSLFEELGGFDENLASLYDIDLCLKARRAGYKVIYASQAEFCSTDSRPEVPFQRQDLTRLVKRWGGEALNDPFYNPNLTLDSEDFFLAFPSRAKKPWRE